MAASEQSRESASALQGDVLLAEGRSGTHIGSTAGSPSFEVWQEQVDSVELGSMT